MNVKGTRILARCKRKIERRVERREWAEQPKPMLAALLPAAAREGRRLKARAERKHIFVTLEGTGRQRMTKKGNMPTNLLTRFKRCVTKAKINPDGVTIHAVRRTFISELIRRGVNIKTVQRLAGHKDPKITLAIYAQMTRADLREGVDVLDFGAENKAEKATDGQQEQVA